MRHRKADGFNTRTQQGVTLDKEGTTGAHPRVRATTRRRVVPGSMVPCGGDMLRWTAATLVRSYGSWGRTIV
jgi:hypothetical protein